MTGVGDRDLSGACVRTQCGRQIVVGRLLIGGARSLIGRVVMRVNCARAERDQLWASLTPTEARTLAGYLLAQADAVEHRTGRPPQTGGAVRARTVRLAAGRRDERGTP